MEIAQPIRSIRPDVIVMRMIKEGRRSSTYFAARDRIARPAGHIADHSDLIIPSKLMLASLKSPSLMALMQESIGNGWPREAAREVLVNYLGFPFFDTLTFPLMRWREVGEFEEVLVDRISAQDTTILRGIDCAEQVRGVDFDHFAAFLSRAFRENDYLLGRLHALDRLIDIVCNSAGANAVRDLDVVGLQMRGFKQILDAEEPHLPNSRAMIAKIRSGLEEVARRQAAHL
jgi:hypothetical protein